MDYYTINAESGGWHSFVGLPPEDSDINDFIEIDLPGGVLVYVHVDCPESVRDALLDSLCAYLEA